MKKRGISELRGQEMISKHVSSQGIGAPQEQARGRGWRRQSTGRAREQLAGQSHELLRPPGSCPGDGGTWSFNWPLAKGCRARSEAERGRKDSALEPPESVRPCWHLDLKLWRPELGEDASVIFSHPVYLSHVFCGALLQQRLPNTSTPRNRLGHQKQGKSERHHSQGELKKL